MLDGDCVELMRGMPDASVDAVVCDPPYGLSQEPDIEEVLQHWIVGDDYQHRGGGFMGRGWDSFVPGPVYWREALRVLKPGGHLVAFGGTRTYDLLVIAARLAGFQVRDTLVWLHGEGMPKSLNLRGEWEGWGTGLKPAMEPVVLARAPLAGTVEATVRANGTGALNIDGCRIHSADSGGREYSGTRMKPGATLGKTGGSWHAVDGGDALPWAEGRRFEGKTKDGRWPANVLLDPESAVRLGDPARFFYCAKTSAAERNAGLEGFDALVSPTMNGGIGGKPHERVCVCESPELGRDASKCASCGGVYDAGDAVAPKRNTHPTVKPIALMRWLCRLVTPPGGVVLDPFCGSGSTGCAAVLEGFRFIGCEQGDPPGDPRFGQIARARIGWWAEHPEGVSLIDRLSAEREREAVAAAGQDALF